MFHGEWLDSGDLGYISAGSLFVTGRSKDLIIRGGRNLYPHELEEAVGEIAEIRKGRVAVFGSSEAGEATEKLVVMAETRKKTAEAQAPLREQINTIASDLVGGPADEVLLVRPNTVLKTSSGKIRRSACRELYEGGMLEQGKVPLWRQVTRLMIGSVPAQLRRLRHGLATTLWRAIREDLLLGSRAPDLDTGHDFAETILAMVD